MDIFTARAHFSAMTALGEATLALKKARDLVLAAHGGTLGGASIHLLVQTATGLLNEMGAELLALKNAPDDDVRAFVALVLARLHCQPVGAPKQGPPQPEPSSSEPPTA
jgi:hypothetical protein